MRSRIASKIIFASFSYRKLYLQAVCLHYCSVDASIARTRGIRRPRTCLNRIFDSCGTGTCCVLYHIFGLERILLATVRAYILLMQLKFDWYPIRQCIVSVPFQLGIGCLGLPRLVLSLMTVYCSAIRQCAARVNRKNRRNEDADKTQRCQSDLMHLLIRD